MDSALGFETGLLEDTVQGSAGQVVCRSAGDCHGACFLRVPELPVAATGADELPTVVGNQTQYVRDLHRGNRIVGRLKVEAAF
jgi:hypothetical protein